MGAVILVQ